MATQNIDTKINAAMQAIAKAIKQLRTEGGGIKTTSRWEVLFSGTQSSGNITLKAPYTNYTFLASYGICNSLDANDVVFGFVYVPHLTAGLKRGKAAIMESDNEAVYIAKGSGTTTLKIINYGHDEYYTTVKQILGFK